MNQDLPSTDRTQITTITLYTNKNNNNKKNKGIPEQGLPWLDEKLSPVRGETALWVAVITQAMMDALSKSKNAEARYHKREAIDWLTGNSKDFINVCLNAGLDPDYIRRKAKKTIANPIFWRADPGKGKRYLERKSYRAKHKAKTKPNSALEELGRILIGPWPIHA